MGRGGLLSPSICISICIVESWSLGISGKLSKLVYSGCILFITVLVLWWVTYNIKPGLTTILDLGYWVTGLPTVLDLGYLQYYTWAPYILDLGYWVTYDIKPVAEFKEFERRFKFKPRFKYGWFHLKLYQMFQDLSRRLI